MERIEELFFGQFWTRFHEMLDYIESAGYEVEFAVEEYVEISDDGDEHFLLRIGQTGNTLWIYRVEAA